MSGNGLRILNVARWWICFTGLFVAAPVVRDILRNYQKWHAALPSDPSAAAFWRTNFYLDIGRFVMEIGLVVLVFFLLKPRPSMFRARGEGESQESAGIDKHAP